MKKNILLFVVPLILTSCGGSNKNVFNPILRFVVASDIHITRIQGADDIKIERFEQIYKYAQEYAKSQSYKGLDHVFINGDGADDASIETQTKYNNCVQEFSKTYNVETTTVLGNHELTSWELKSYEEIIEDYKKVTGATELDYHLKLGDYHFIMMSPRNKKWQYVEEESAPWLEKQLQIAANDDPTGTKPIFVFQHVGIKDTCYGTEVDYQTYSDGFGFEHEAVLMPKVLEKYPQVIHFSSHTHRPISDPRMIMQNKFTSISTGSLSYYEMDLVGLSPNCIFALPDGNYRYSILRDFQELDASQFLICEVDAKGAVKVMPYDVAKHGFVGNSYLIHPFTAVSDFDYTSARKYESVTPEFNKGRFANIEVGKLSADFDIYNTPDAQNYRCELYRNDTLMRTVYRVSNTWMPEQPKTFNLRFDLLLPNTDYSLRVYAVNSWGKECRDPIVYDFRTEPLIDIPLND